MLITWSTPGNQVQQAIKYSRRQLHMHRSRVWYSTVADGAWPLSATCRIGYSMIDSAEKEGKITPGKVSSNLKSNSVMRQQQGAGFWVRSLPAR
jgi:hypothetical protein